MLFHTSIAKTQTTVVIIKAARLIDGRGGVALEAAMVRIEGEKIAETGTQIKIPQGAKVIDLGNDATLLPGLIDLHTHLIVQNLADGLEEITKAVRTNFKHSAVSSKNYT